MNYVALLMSTRAHWILQSPDPAQLEKVRSTDASSSLSPLVQRLLCLRGFCEPEDIERFLFPKLSDLSDPFLLPDMDKAVARLFQAVDAGEKTVLYGDYDVDGVTSLTLLKTVLAAYGLDAATFLPHRSQDGYGVSGNGLDRCLSEHSPTLLVAVDCGTSSATEIARLKEQGIDTLILDHHECPPDGRPDCTALVNPKTCPGKGGYEYLCSAGVVFKVGHALLKTRQVPEFDLRRLLDIAALGTVADIVPLVGENRLIVQRGLRELEHTGNPGLRELKRVAKLDGRIQASDVGFRLGPRLNAAGRVDTAQHSLDLLLATSLEEARSLADTLDGHNRERQTLEHDTYDQARSLLEKHFDPAGDSCIVLGSADWHPGVVGIVASRLSRTYHRPTFVIAFAGDGTGKGSGRSVDEFSLVGAINHCRGLLINGGGHDMAAGITLRQENLDAFRETFGECVRRATAGTADLLTRRLHIDSLTDFSELELSMLDSYELLQPFGNANPEPLLMARGVTPVVEPRVLKGRHLKLRLAQSTHVREAIYFGGAAHDLPPPPWDVAFHVHRNAFRGSVNLQLTVQAIRGAEL